MLDCPEQTNRVTWPLAVHATVGGRVGLAGFSAYGNAEVGAVRLPAVVDLQGLPAAGRVQFVSLGDAGSNRLWFPSITFKRCAKCSWFNAR